MARIIKGAKAVTAVAASRPAGGRRFGVSVGKGESAIFRFFGDFESEEAPVASFKHYVKGLPAGKRDDWCPKDEHDQGNCVDCYVKQTTGRKDIARSLRTIFEVLDLRPTHKLEERVSVKDGDRTYETSYPPCLAAKRLPCPYCAAGKPKSDGGFGPFDIPQSEGLKFVQQVYSRARTFCGRCYQASDDGMGTLIVGAYACASCNQEAPETYNPHAPDPRLHCAGCGHREMPKEYLTCNNPDCETEEYGAERAKMHNFRVRVTRTGESQQTMGWAFELIGVRSPATEEELTRYESAKIDWDAFLSSKPLEVRAADYGIPNPFGPTDGHGSVSYDQVPHHGDGGSDIMFDAPDPAPSPLRRPAPPPPARPSAPPVPPARPAVTARPAARPGTPVRPFFSKR